MAKTVLITGCSSGFGRASARMFGEHGWNVVATMRDTADAGDLADNDAILVTRLDVADQSSIDPAIAAGVHRFGVVDVVVNNAGYGCSRSSRERPAKRYSVSLTSTCLG